jgi:hypothetical protein
LTASLSSERSLIEDEIKTELTETLSNHGLEVDNVYLSSLTPINSPMQEEEKKRIFDETYRPKTVEEMKNERVNQIE